VPISGTDHSGKINSAYNEGPRRLVATVSDALGIPINHYVEIDFEGFTSLVDAIGGVEICTIYAAQDLSSGLRLDPGCTTIDGTMALAYARSRHYEEWIDGDWVEAPGADLGRIQRQQLFIRNTVTKLLKTLESNPFALSDLISAATSAVAIDEGLDVVKASDALREAAEVGLQTYTLPVEGVMKGDQSALELLDEAEPILDYFRGVAPAPPVPSTTVPG
jgi:LCP family protein required for cell wall assembly